MSGLWSIIWLIVFLVIGWDIGCFCSYWFVLLSPCWVCIDALTPVIRFLWIGTCFPILNAKYIKEGKEGLPSFCDLGKDLAGLFAKFLSPI